MQMRGGGWYLRVLGVCFAVSLLVSSACDEGDADVTRSAAGAGGQASSSGGAPSGGSGGITIIGGGSAGITSAGGGPAFEPIAAPLVLCGSGEGGAAGRPAQGGAANDDGGTAGQPGGAAGQPETGAAGAPAHDDTCAPPPSQCADMNNLVYFSEGTCVDGRCRWTQTATWCTQMCTADGCYLNITK